MSEEKRKPIPTWAYKDGGAKLFDHPDDIPKGWADSPAAVAEKKPKGSPKQEVSE